MTVITKQTVVVISKHATHETLDDTTVILNIQTGRIFHVDEVGTRIWELLLKQAAAGLESVLTTLLDEYEVSQDFLWAEMKRFLLELKEIGLIEIALQE